MQTSKIKSEDIVYIIVPHLNSRANAGCQGWRKLLTSNDKSYVDKMVTTLIDNNKERKRIQDLTYKRCLEIVDEFHSEDLFLIIHGKDAHEGIAGIVAGKIKDAYGRPAILVTYSGEDELLKGTGRSIEGVNLYEMLKKYEDLFIKFGGHSGACGFLMKADHLDEMRKSLNGDLKNLYDANPDLLNPRIQTEGTLNDKELEIQLALDIEKLGPFGHKNEKPIFSINSVTPSNICYMGDNGQHVRFTGVGKEGKSFSCILFQKAKEYKDLIDQGKPLNLIGHIDINSWNGNSKYIVLRDITC